MSKNDFNPDIWRKKPSQSRAEKTTEAILQSAKQLFTTEGYYKTTTNHIADRAGVGIGSLYDYFPNREAIAKALLEETAENISEDVRTLFSDHLEDSIENIVPLIFGVIFNWYKTHQNVLIKLINEAPELRQTSQALSIEKLISRTSRLYMTQHQQEYSIKNITATHEFLSMTVIASIKEYLCSDKNQLSEEFFLEHLYRMAVTFLRTES